jgi:O-antigen ligase
MVLIAAGSVLIGASPKIGGDSVLEQLRIVSLPEDETVMQRLYLGRLAWQEFLENPLFGSGFSLPVTGEYPHNIILETGMAMGVFGLALFLFLIATGLRQAFLAIRGNGDGFMASLFVYDLVASQFSGSLWGQTMLFVTMGRILSHPVMHLISDSNPEAHRQVFVVSKDSA